MLYFYAVGKYGDQRAKHYKVDITSATYARSEGTTTRDSSLTRMLSKSIYFVQTDDGSIPATYYSREEDPEMINTKKAIISLFQANFKGTKEKQEADPQSLHKAKYRFE